MSETKLNDTIVTNTSFIHPKDSKQNHRINMPMVQNVLLVWLDGNIDQNSSEYQDTIKNFRRVINTIHSFIDSEQCIEFLEDMVDENVCMIIPSYLGRQIIHRIHHLSQMNSFFILCGNKNNNEEWAKNWSKIKGIFTEIEPICNALKQTAQQCEQNAISISIMNSRDDLINQNLNPLESFFMYTQITKEIFLSITFEQQDIDEFVERCRELLADNSTELKNLDEFTRKYRQHTPIWWYTYECFLSSLLNRVLLTLDMDLSMKLGFFISDLHHHIEQLHREQFSSESSKQQFIVYRGQGIKNDLFKMIVENKGGLLSFNCFLSTNKNFQTSLDFAQHAVSNPEMIGVLFIINIDPVESSSPFASIIDVGYFEKLEDEVLFSMNTIFRIGEMTPLSDDSRLVQVELNLINDNDSDHCQLIDRIQKETFSDVEGWHRLGQVLWTMGNLTEAQHLYEILLKKETTTDNGKVSIYDQLGTIKVQLEEYAEAIGYFEKSIAIQEKQIIRNDQNLANAYNNIGLLYSNMGDYSKALLSQEKALTIRQQSLPSNHPNLANSYNNIGLIYFNMTEYAKALSSHDQALAMKQQSLPPTHPSLANSYNNIGLVHFSMRDYPQALSSYEQAVKIQQQSLPSNHPDLASSYNNIGNVYYEMSDYQKALSFFEKALVIKEESFPSNHPNLASSYNSIGLTYENMENYSEAHSFFQRAVDIGQHSLPPDHADLQIWIKNLARMKTKL